jgi:hypothetical protein
MLIRTMPRDQTSAGAVAYVGVILLWHSEFGKNKHHIGKRGHMLTKAHVWCASTVHIAGLCVPRGEPEISEFDRDHALVLASIGIEDTSICNHEILRFDVSVEDAVTVAVSDGFAHLREHGG